MRTEADTVLQALAVITTAKESGNIIPTHALRIEVSGYTGILVDKVAVAADLLLREGHVIAIGQTLNDVYYVIENTKKTEIMNEFEKAIKTFIEQKAKEDAAFAEKYEAKGGAKCIHDCCNYIITQVQKSKRQGFTDPEIYSMAMHFIDENIKAPKSAPNCKVVVNREIELSKEEKEKLEKEAKKKLEDEYRAKEEKRLRAEEERKTKRIAEQKAAAKKEAEAGTLFLFGMED